MKKNLAYIFIISLFMMNCSNAQLSETEFSKKFVTELQKKVNGLEVVSINGLEVTTKLKNSDDYRHFLDNAYAEYKNAPKEIKEVLEKYVNGSKDLFLPKQPIKLERIVPVIKDKRFLNETAKLNPDFKTDYIYEKYNSELYIFYAEDKENTISYLTKKELDSLNIERDSLKKKSIENLNSILPEMERHGGDGYFMLTAGGVYESSIILFDIWNKENFNVKGEIVIGIPSRDLLIITGSKETESLKKMSEMIKEINENGDHIVSDKMFEMNKGIFELKK